MEHEHTHHEEHSIKELILLIKYLVKHNESHTKELDDLCDELSEHGFTNAHENVINAIKKYEEGNALLSKALEEIKED